MSGLLIQLVLCGITACIYAQTPCTDEGSVRLEGLSSSLAGRVEICHNGVWGTICGESGTIPWSEKNGQVACRQLGYSGVLNSILQDMLPVSSRASGHVPVHYYGFSCFGNEVTLTDCLGVSEVGPNHHCPHDNDVAITCRSTREAFADVGDLRLTGDSANGHGAVQLFDETFGWINVCYDSTWGDDEANVLCRQLGYESGTARSYIYSIETSSLTASSFSCNKDSDDVISDCTYLTSGSCSSFLLGGIECSSSSLPEGSIHLAGSTLPNAGRVEILYNGRWGTICDSLWDDTDGGVVCQQLGLRFDVADTFRHGTYSDPSSINPVWLTNISCSSNDLELSDCDRGNPIGYTNCIGGDAELECRITSSSTIDNSSGLSPGAIVGIVFGAITCIIILLVIIFWKWIWKTWKNCWNQKNAPLPTLSTIEADEPTQIEQGTDTEFDKLLPPSSYQASSSFPAADLASNQPLPTDLLPPYHGPQLNPYPPAPYPYSSSFQVPDLLDHSATPDTA